MKYIEVPGSGSFLAPITQEDDQNYYVESFGHTWSIAKEAVVDWDSTRFVPPYWHRVPDYQVDFKKHHLVRILP
jgi:hypothetical protein